MTVATDRSQLQTQMGQEVIYLLLTSSMLGCIILAAYVLLNMRSPSELVKDIARITAEHEAAEEARRAAERRIKELERDLAGVKGAGIDKPPIINLREADEFNFVQGSAEISAPFAEKIRREIVPEIISRAKAYNAKVIEIIGHTDGVPVGPNLKAKANLDSMISAFVDAQVKEAPVPYDNAGLGMARAVAVARLLKQSGINEEYEILPLSAGSLIAPDDRYSPGNAKEPDQARRRIEIRLRRRHPPGP